jgi:dipeptidyl aminopeptidase/acylaminoacyl peptidase
MTEDGLRQALGILAGDTTPSPSAASEVASIASRRVRRRRLAVGAAAFAVVLGAVGLFGDGRESSVRTVPAGPTTPGPTVVALTRGGAVRLVDVSNGRTVRTLVERGVDGGVTRSPDGTTVYYGDSGTGCANGWIHIVPADGSSPPKRLVEGTRPSVSPDGTRLAFWTRQSGDTGCDLSLVVRVPATGAEQRWTRPNGYFRGGPIERIDWSPDGRRLLISKNLLVLDLTRPGPLDGATSIPLTIATGNGKEVRHSPDDIALAWRPGAGDEGRIAMEVSCCGLPLDESHVVLVDPDAGTIDALLFSSDSRPVVLDFDPSGDDVAWVDDKGRLRVRDTLGRTRSLGAGYREVAW